MLLIRSGNMAARCERHCRPSHLLLPSSLLPDLEAEMQCLGLLQSFAIISRGSCSACKIKRERRKLRRFSWQGQWFKNLGVELIHVRESIARLSLKDKKPNIFEQCVSKRYSKLFKCGYWISNCPDLVIGTGTRPELHLEAIVQTHAEVCELSCDGIM